MKNPRYDLPDAVTVAPVVGAVGGRVPDSSRRLLFRRVRDSHVLFPEPPDVGRVSGGERGLLSDPRHPGRRDLVSVSLGMDRVRGRGVRRLKDSGHCWGRGT